MDAYVSIARQEGFKSGLYRGTGPNIARYNYIVLQGGRLFIALVLKVL